MLKDKHTDYEISKLQKQIDRKKVTTVTNKVTNVTTPVQPGTVLGKPIATDMQVADGQVLIYNKVKKQWEPGTIEGGSGFTGTMDDIPDGTTYVKTENNYTDADASKLAGIAAGAEVNVNADWNAGSGDAQILNKPTIPTVSDVAYDATTWDNNTDAPTKNAVRDKFESLTSGSGLSQAQVLVRSLGC